MTVCQASSAPAPTTRIVAPPTTTSRALTPEAASPRDDHFVELQRIDALFDGHAARAWGLGKGSLAIMINSGSVGLGHAVGGHFMDRAREIFPMGVKAPKGGFYPLPTSGPRADEGLFYLDGMGNAANFAFANRPLPRAHGRTRHRGWHRVGA